MWCVQACGIKIRVSKKALDSSGSKGCRKGTAFPNKYIFGLRKYLKYSSVIFRTRNLRLRKAEDMSSITLDLESWSGIFCDWTVFHFTWSQLLFFFFFFFCCFQCYHENHLNCFKNSYQIGSVHPQLYRRNRFTDHWLVMDSCLSLLKF